MWPALILGTAWLIRRVRRRTRAEATASQRPYLVVLALVAVVSFALSLVDHVLGTYCGVLFPAHPGLAVGRRRVGRPDRRPVAPAVAASRRDHRVGRVGG